MRLVAVCLVAVACSAAFASEPGQPLDCEDWTVVAPGLTIEAEQDIWNVSRPTATDRVAFDNEGFRIIIKEGITAVPTSTCGERQLPILRAMRGGAYELLACVRAREGVGYTDYARVWESACFSPPYGGGACVRFNPITGDLFFNYERYGAAYANSPTWCVMHGLPTLYDVQQTYAPATSGFGFRVPAMPEGLPAADHFDSYWGNLSTVGDWSQAHPLQCNYPAAAPHVGDYLTVADTVPTPLPGRGIYYVTAATYQGARRCGRKTTAGHLSGRDPAGLPACRP